VRSDVFLRSIVSQRRYDILAVDLDGTLVNSKGEISPRNAAAMRAAREAGLHIVVCTGRGLVECRRYLSVIGQVAEVVVAGGSIIADPGTGRTVHRFSMDRSLVTDVVSRLLEKDFAAMVLKDPAEAGYDYLVVRGHKRLHVGPVMDWWFETMRLQVRYIDHLHEDEHPEHSVRVGAFGLSGGMSAVASELKTAIEGRGHLHHFSAVVSPEHRTRLPEGQMFHILELFDEKANKWSAVSWLAQRDGINPARIAAIGDEVNDVAMIKGAGLGIAMGNAIQPVRDAASRLAPTNDEDGVAFAVQRILSGEW
jgi:5-amino-6-(5-phospho-D-ribitylamino)uracil phosphatase